VRNFQTMMLKAKNAVELNRLAKSQDLLNSFRDMLMNPRAQGMAMAAGGAIAGGMAGNALGDVSGIEGQDGNGPLEGLGMMAGAAGGAGLGSQLLKKAMMRRGA
jgi:hypothetical protein